MSLPRVTLRLSHRIAAIGALGIVGLVAVAVIYMTGASSQEHYRGVAERAKAIGTIADKLSLTLLQARRAEKDFLLRADEQYVSHHTDLTKTIRADLDAIKQQAGGAGRPDV